MWNSESEENYGGSSPKSTPSAEELYPLKRKRDPVSEFDKKRAKEAGLSLETRARRKRELLELREENETLRKERAEFLNKIQELEQESIEVMNEHNMDPRLASENDIIRAQIEEHKLFIGRFLKLLESSEPCEQPSSEKVIYKEGAESAQSYLMSLISESQDEWTRLKVPQSFSSIGPLENLQMSYKLGQDTFVSVPGNEMRMNIRFDCLIQNTTPDLVGNLFWNAFSNQDTLRRMYKNSTIQLKPVKGEMPDKDTQVVHFKHDFNGAAEDQDVVFVVNRQRKLLAKSTLTPPRKSAGGRAGGRPAFPLEDFGQTSALCVATTSTTLRPKETLPVSGETRFKSLVVKGVVMWEEEGNTRVVVVYSVPGSYKVINAINIQDIISARGDMSTKFIQLVSNVAREFSGLLKEQTERFKQGSIPAEEIDVHLDVPDRTNIIKETVSEIMQQRALESIYRADDLFSD